MGKVPLLGLSNLVALLIVAGAWPAVAAAAIDPLSQLAWLSGVWRGAGLGGQLEDVYQPLDNGEILSTLRLVSGGKVVRYELRSIHEEHGAIVFQELAYGPGLQPAPAVPTRALVVADARHAEFDGLTLTRTGENAMRVAVAIRTPSGDQQTVTIDYVRVQRFSPP